MIQIQAVTHKVTTELPVVTLEGSLLDLCGFWPNVQRPDCAALMTRVTALKPFYFPSLHQVGMSDLLVCDGRLTIGHLIMGSSGTSCLSEAEPHRLSAFFLFKLSSNC